MVLHEAIDPNTQVTPVSLSGVNTDNCMAILPHFPGGDSGAGGNAQCGRGPVHFAIIMVINMELAVITPPIGMNLFVISSISGVPIARVFRGTLPFIGLIAAMLLLCTYSEQASLWSLRLLG